LREATRAGAGVGLLPTFIADALVASGDLVPVLSSLRFSSARLVMLYPATGPVAPKVTAFRDVLIAALRRPTSS
jgi:DNA-binding transcriptional LysR family regulator